VSALSPILRSLEGGSVLFWCPGCKTGHQVRVSSAQSNWGYNGNPDAPTFTPSVLVRGTVRITEDERLRILGGEIIAVRPLVCHSFVTDGQIQFLSDSTHELAGQTVPLPVFPGWQE
jgi:hypothetical protein